MLPPLPSASDSPARLFSPTSRRQDSAFVFTAPSSIRFAKHSLANRQFRLTWKRGHSHVNS